MLSLIIIKNNNSLIEFKSLYLIRSRTTEIISFSHHFLWKTYVKLKNNHVDIPFFTLPYPVLWINYKVMNIVIHTVMNITLT